MDEEQKEQIRRQQVLDQREEEMVQNLPRIWFRMYEQLQKEGFQRNESMEILHHFMEITHRNK